MFCWWCLEIDCQMVFFFHCLEFSMSACCSCNWVSSVQSMDGLLKWYSSCVVKNDVFWIYINTCHAVCFITMWRILWTSWTPSISMCGILNQPSLMGSWNNYVVSTSNLDASQNYESLMESWSAYTQACRCSCNEVNVSTESLLHPQKSWWKVVPPYIFHGAIV